ncbi:polygalacturonase [Colletotrichum asianum]
MWRFGGEDVNIYGLGQGTIDGLGQTWWNALISNSTVVRPLLLGTDGLKGGSITGLKMINSPNWFNIIANSSDILISDMDLSVVNTDGWDTYRSDNIVIQNSVIDNTNGAIQITQCYFAASDEACQQYPATLVIEDILFRDFTGTTSKENDPRVGSLICSDPSVCKNIQAHNINVSPPSGKDPKWTCTNMDNSLLDIDCI